MTTKELEIDDVLKLSLNSLMEQFESHRVFNKNLKTIKKVVEDKIAAEEIIEPKKAKKEESFFHKFFFSEY